MTYASETRDLAGRRASLRTNAVAGVRPDAPLLIALHGGGYSSAYFDIAGFSLLERAAANRISAIALDRPGYGATEASSLDEHGHVGNATALSDLIDALWQEHGARSCGIVLIGHSIGGAIALMIAARGPEWPLLGVAVSGIGLTNAPGDRDAWEALPPVASIAFPPELKDSKMFGRADTYAADAPGRSHAADAPALRQELIDIVRTWPESATDWLGRIAVPVHYRQASEDALWTVSEDEIARFVAACRRSPWIDAVAVAKAGHCIDFHRLGAAFQLEQIAFALKCAALNKMGA